MNPLTFRTDAVLDLYRDSLRAAVRQGRLDEFSLTPLDRLNLPLWTVSLIGIDAALADGFGYGLDETAAKVSAWGETLEWYWARERLKCVPRLQGSRNDILRRGRTAVDPVELGLAAGALYHPENTVLEWVEARSYPGNDPVWVPVEFAAPRWADLGTSARAERVSVPITNGMGAGPTFEHALAHGVLELLQRDGNSVNYRALDQGILVDCSSAQDPENRALLEHFDRSGIELMVKLAADDFGFPNVHVVGFDREPARAVHPIALSACGEAVHPDRERALAKALREFASARARKTFNHGPLGLVRKVAPSGYLERFSAGTLRNEDERAFREMQSWLRLSATDFLELLRRPVFEVTKRVPFSSLPTVDAGDTANGRVLLDALVRRLGPMPVYYVDFSPPGREVQVLKAIVPGLEVETMTYHRIGARNLQRLLARGETFVGLGKGPSSAEPIFLPVALTGGYKTPWLDPQALRARLGRLYPLYREPGRHTVPLLSGWPD